QAAGKVQRRRTMTTTRATALFFSTLLGVAIAGTPAEAHGPWLVGVRFGLPVYYGPWWPAYGYYAYPPVYVQPMPVYVQPPIMAQPAPVVQPVCPPAPAPSSGSTVSQPEIDRHLQMLSHANDQVRA